DLVWGKVVHGLGKHRVTPFVRRLADLTDDLEHRCEGHPSARHHLRVGTKRQHMCNHQPGNVPLQAPHSPLRRVHVDDRAVDFAAAANGQRLAKQGCWTAFYKCG
ncbi:unnamed protein product, partial [Phaeothamnion confervicola]